MNEPKIKNSTYTKYRFIKVLGKGSYGTVYQAINEDDKNTYVIKKITLKENDSLETIKNEANILKRINSENIVKYYDSFIDKNDYNIVMEYCNNNDLRTFIDMHKKLNKLIDENIIFIIISDICLGLKAIYNKNIIHRDLKPSNIFISRDYKIKIGDFGISKILNNINDYAQSTVGTLQYTAPEILKGEKYNHKADIWSLGCIIYELLTLDICFNCPNIAGLINIILNGNHGQYDLKYDKCEWKKIIGLLLQTDYKKRPNIDEILILLNKYEKNYFFEEKFFNTLSTIDLNILKRKKWKKNQIVLTVKINEWDINKDIYFLDNTYYIDENGFKHFHDGLTELNETNVRLYINDVEYAFKKYFNFSKEGEYIITLKFKNKIKDCSKMFSYCHNIINIDLSSFDSSNITNASEMFCGHFLNNYDFSHFNSRNIIDMSRMFFNCNLSNINFSFLNTENVKDMSEMFSHCNLNDINFAYLNTKNVTNMRGMFSFCNCSNINFSLKTNNVTNMSSMFSDCCNLENIDLSKFDTQNVVDMSYMFKNCKKLKNVNLSSFNTKKVIKMFAMFQGCDLKNVDFSSFDTTNVTDMVGLFTGCDYIENIHLSSLNSINVTDMSQMFSNCNLKNLNFSFLETKNVKIMSRMFEHCNIENVIFTFPNINKVVSMKEMFYGCKNFNLDLSSLKINNNACLSLMFAFSKLITLDLSSFDSISKNELLFYNCFHLKKIIVKKGNNYKAIQLSMDKLNKECNNNCQLCIL